MKKYYFLFILFSASIFSVSSLKATVHIITAEGTTIPTDVYTPLITYAVVGDTITWVWVSGVHTTESVTIPADATPWSALLDASHLSFTYVVTVPGSYYFDCHHAFSHGMNATIEVTEATAVNPDKNEMVSSAYPNPFNDRVTFESLNVEEVRVYNLGGQEIISKKINGNQTEFELNTSELSSGIYFFSFLKNGVLTEPQKLVKE